VWHTSKVCHTSATPFAAKKTDCDTLPSTRNVKIAPVAKPFWLFDNLCGTWEMNNLLYEQILNFPHLRVDEVAIDSKTIYLNCHLDIDSGVCPQCLKACKTFKSYHTYTLRDLNIKWLLYHQRHTLSLTEKDNLAQAFKMAPVLEELYMLKHTFCALFDMDIPVEKAMTQINEWVEYAQTVSNEFLTTFLAFFKRQIIPITNYFKHKVSNAVTGGNNNIMTTVKRFTFNLTNFEHFKARCFAFKM